MRRCGASAAAARTCAAPGDCWRVKPPRGCAPAVGPGTARRWLAADGFSLPFPANCRYTDSDNTLRGCVPAVGPGTGRRWLNVRTRPGGRLTPRVRAVTLMRDGAGQGSDWVVGRRDDVRQRECLPAWRRHLSHAESQWSPVLRAAGHGRCGGLLWGRQPCAGELRESDQPRSGPSQRQPRACAVRVASGEHGRPHLRNGARLAIAVRPGAAGYSDHSTHHTPPLSA